jgi:uncharacterized protein (UPF0333 family)
MPGSATAEIVFIAAMMVLILILSFVAVYFFMRQYKKEMAAKAIAKKAKEDAKLVAEREPNENES